MAKRLRLFIFTKKESALFAREQAKPNAGHAMAPALFGIGIQVPIAPVHRAEAQARSIVRIAMVQAMNSQSLCEKLRR